ncbi:radical SAM protein [bacterium]|nr:MAG: radical SAM protein [bacterium]
MELLLTHGYFLEKDEHEKRVMKPYPPLGILYLSSYLKSKGISVSVFDSTFRRMEDFTGYLKEHRPSIVGIYCNLMTKLNVLAMIRLCKSMGSTVLLGGPEPSSYAKEFLDSGADVIIIGEGEITTEAVMHSIVRAGVHRLHDVHGIAFRDESGTILHTPPRPLIQDLDTLPFPDREAIDIDRYVSTWREHHERGSLSLITARGCPYTCKWCSHGVYGFSHRRRSPENVVNEIELVVGRYKPDMLWIADDVFTINHKWLHEYAAEMNRRNVRIPFECISRADRLNDQVMEVMANLGCYRIWFGSESGSQRVLDAMSRGVTVTEIQEATRRAQRHGIEAGLFVMLGYDGETIEDIDATIDHLKVTQANTFLTTVAYPIKGTAYYRENQERVETLEPWEERTERDVRIRGRHSDLFYWFAQRRLTNEVLFHSLKIRKNGRLLDRVSAFAKAKVAHLGMLSTRYSKS